MLRRRRTYTHKGKIRFKYRMPRKKKKKWKKQVEKELLMLNACYSLSYLSLSKDWNSKADERWNKL